MTKYWPVAFFSFAAGIVMAYWESWLLSLGLISFLILLGLFFRAYIDKITICCLLLLFGILYFNMAGYHLPKQLAVIERASLTGTVDDFPYYDGKKTTFYFSPDKPGAYQKNIRVVCLFHPPISRGDKIKIQGSLKPPRRPGNPGEFDYPAYLANNGVYYSLTVKQDSDLKLISKETGLLKWIDSFRKKGEVLTKNTLPPRESSIILGMLLGTREGIDEEQYDDFQKTGIVHLFSVSGLHVGFLLLLIAWITSLTGMSARNKFLTGVAVLLIYGTMIAWPVCVIRAILMGILGLLAYYSGRENGLINALAIAGIVILLINPNSLFNISFQLTMLATWGLIYLFPVLREHFPYKGKLWDLILMPVCAELAVLPLVAYYFNILTPVSIITNILVSYLSGAAVILGFITLFLAAFLPGLAVLFLYPAGLMVEMILYIVQGMKLVPGGFLWVATPGMWLIALYFTGLLLGILALANPGYSRLSIPAGALVGVFFIFLLIPGSFYNKGYMEADFIDVGQGDAILLKTPRGKFVLVDGGGNQLYDVGNRTVLPYLHRRGIRELFMIINTHPDWDHLGGLLTVAGQMKVSYIGLPASVYNCKEYDSLKNAARDNDSKLLQLSAGQYINLEKDLEVKVLHAGKKDITPDGFNDDSVVLLVSYRDLSVLLTGDISKQAMEDILRRTDLKHITVVKVPHHGSKGSLLPKFYETIQPRYAVISVGYNNIFGHPNPGVIDMLNQNHIKVLRTDQAGAVTILSDGWKIKTHGTVVQDY